MSAPRKRIVGPLNLVVISVLFMIAFSVLRPEESDYSLQGESQKSSRSSYVDALDIAYLKARRANGEQTADDVVLAFDLFLESRRPADARKLSAAFPEVILSDRALMHLDIEESAERLHLAVIAGEQTDALTSMRDELMRLLEASTLHTPALLKRAISISRTLPEPDLTASLFRTLADLESGQKAHWLQQCALTLNKESSLPQSKSCLMDARTFVLNMDETPDRTEQLYGVIDSARALGEQKLALEWADMLVLQEPDGTRALSLQLALALENSKLDEALKAVQHLVRLQPDSPQIRRQFAQLLEWTGDASGAARQWQWMATHVADEHSLQQSIRLSTLILDPAAAAQSAKALADKREPDSAEVRFLVELLELDGRPDAAVLALEEFMRRYGANTKTLKTLADLHRRHVNLEEALATWNRIAQLSGRGFEETINRIEMHWRLNEREPVLSLMDDLRDMPFDDTITEYQVVLLAELAWRYRLSWFAPRLLTALMQIDDKEQIVLQGMRQLRALAATCQGALAVHEAQRLWQATDDSQFAILAMQQAYRIGDIDAFEMFQRETDKTRALHRHPEYWTLLATIHQQQQDTVKARRAYEQVLAFDPMDEHALSEILWMSVEARDMKGMRTFVDAHARTARAMPGLWAPMATALARLGEAESSLAWFERMGDSIAEDETLQQLYANMLERTGHVDDAIELRHSINRLADSADNDPPLANDPCL